MAEHQNADGGWGDTTDSPSNLATTLLSVAALNLGPQRKLPAASSALEKAGRYLAAAECAGTVAHEAMQQEYGEDRTFAVPILMNCGLAGIVAWDGIPDLPFELAVFPPSLVQAVAVAGRQLCPARVDCHRPVDRSQNPPRSFLRRLLRRIITPRVLEKLRRIQPEHGGFLEATPLTSFVAMGLIPLYGRQHGVAGKCLRFVRQSQRRTAVGQSIRISRYG